ncbi:hypothetical protein [Mycolicibacterium sphagni]|uniref:Fur family transcriptional regulator n=1 Tax=Mycolicibacterium sphagni TaxID=1786 RepID=A0ABX2K7A9_9MYCO|nr:hypothetical protein [Mycolicibacterium sphagni]NTY62100.1 hypothetical protein [Mycolicibacterium sphagni]
MSNSPTTRRRQGEHLRAQLMAALAAAPAPMTTAELREHLDTQLGRPIVIEKIYRALVILAGRGEIHRVPTRGRNTQWASTPAAQRNSADTVSQQTADVPLRSTDGRPQRPAI